MKLYGIIGKPLDSSLSPKLYQAFFKKFLPDTRYLPFQVEKPHLKNLIACMKLVDVMGLNITSPYKEAVLPYLDGTEGLGKLCGAVNTIVRIKNRFYGINTDGPGFVLALKHRGKFNPGEKRVFVLGAGGAARGIAGALAGNGAQSIIVANRHFDKAKKMVREMKKNFPKTKWMAVPLSPVSLKKFFPQTDLLIQATSSPKVNFPLTLLPRQALVADIIYQPRETPLLKKAKKLKLKTLGGLWMFVHQASLNIETWFHKKIDPAWLFRILS